MCKIGFYVFLISGIFQSSVDWCEGIARSRNPKRQVVVTSHPETPASGFVFCCYANISA